MRKTFVGLFCIAVVLLATGCVQLDTQVTVDQDGTGTIQHTLRVNYLVRQATDVDEHLRDLKEEMDAGYTLEKTEERGARIGMLTREYKTMEEIQDELYIEAIPKEQHPFLEKYGLEIDGTTQEEQDRIYQIKDTLDLQDTLDDNGETVQKQGLGREQLLQGIRASVRLTLPQKAIDHNADSVEKEGRELYWDLSTTQANEIYVQFELPLTK